MHLLDQPLDCRRGGSIKSQAFPTPGTTALWGKTFDLFHEHGTNRTTYTPQVLPLTVFRPTELATTAIRAYSIYRYDHRLVENILSDGRRYLCGDSISAADIAFASMAFPVILPEETASVFVAYDPRSLPRGYVEIIKRCG